GGHRAPGRHADHEVQGRREAGALEVGLAAVGPRDDEVQRQREGEREQEEPAVAEGAHQLQPGVGRAAHAASPSSSWRSSSPPVSSRKASSSPAPLISMSLTAGAWASSARMAASESVQLSTTASPRSSAPA